MVFSFPLVKMFIGSSWRCGNIFPPFIVSPCMGSRSFCWRGGRRKRFGRFWGAPGRRLLVIRSCIRSLRFLVQISVWMKRKRSFSKKQGHHRPEKRGVQKRVSLREKDDSFSFFYIRKYCASVVPKVRRKTQKIWWKSSLWIWARVIRDYLFCFQGSYLLFLSLFIGEKILQ